MKKTHLFAATALLSALLVAGLTEANAATKPAAAETKAATSEQMPMMKDHAGMSKMSEAGQKIMKETMDKYRESNKSTMDEVKAKHEELREIMKAPTFDKSAYLAKHEEVQALMAKMAAGRAEALATAAEKMTPEDRAGILGQKGMRHGGKGMGKMGMGKGMHDDCPMGGDCAGMMKDGGAETPAKK